MKIGTKWAILQSAGVISSASSFRKRADMASGPVALCALRLLNSLWTPRGLMTMLSIVENGLGPLSGVWLVSSEVKMDLNCSFRMYVSLGLWVAGYKSI